MLVIIALPYGCTRSTVQFVDPLAGSGFKLSDNSTERTRWWTVWTSWGVGATRRVALTGYDNDTVKMIGHNDENIQFNVLSNICGLNPFGFNHASIFIQSHFTFDHIPKNEFPVVCTYGDKMGSRL